MEEELIIPILFFFIAALGGICLLIFCFRKNDNGYDYDKIIRMMHEQCHYIHIYNNIHHALKLLLFHL